MKFKEATDELFSGISHDELAMKLGVSVASIKQARLQSSARAHRRPPENWEDALVDLAEARIRRYRKLIERLLGQPGGVYQRDFGLPPPKAGGAALRHRSAEA